jgi:uncharacterized protein
MISVDTNILLPAVDQSSGSHAGAAAFMELLQERDDVAISEFILLELYNLLRNPTVVVKALAASTAVDVCEAFRQHPHWHVIGFPPDSRSFHDAFWPRLRESNFARRRAFDWRVALSMQRSGVTEFATVNTKDFEGLGFARVWNPLQQ